MPRSPAWTSSPYLGASNSADAFGDSCHNRCCRPCLVLSADPGSGTRSPRSHGHLVLLLDHVGRSKCHTGLYAVSNLLLMNEKTDLACRLGDQAQRRALEKFRPEQIAYRWAELLQEFRKWAFVHDNSCACMRDLGELLALASARQLTADRCCVLHRY